MPDVFTKAKRSQVMSRIRGRGNRETEVALAKLFRAHEIVGWRRHYPIFGNPDFAFPRLRLAIFVDGCFWHCCPVHVNFPKSNSAFWRRKLDGNRRRDRLVGRELRKRGWRVMRIWEHAMKDPVRVIRRVRRVLDINLD
jgi:DNA mismatch endonuclease (patch repair protein)